MNRNTKLLFIFIGQLVVIGILFSVNNADRSLNYDPKLFSVADTAAIESIQIEGVETINIQPVSGKWYVNEKFQADRALMHTIKSVLNRVEVVRPVSDKVNPEILTNLKENGTTVKVIIDGNPIEFLAGGNDSRTISYFAKDDQVYRVGIPGYQDYVSAIFGLKEIQWKDRVIFNSTWTSINSIEVSKQNGNGFTVVYENSDLFIPEVTPLDSSKMMQYVYQFEGYMINEYIQPGQFSRYDSLSETSPMGVLTISDIDESKNVSVKVFPALANEGYHLAIDDKNRWMMIDRRRVLGLLPDKDVFKKVNEPNRLR